MRRARVPRHHRLALRETVLVSIILDTFDPLTYNIYPRQPFAHAAINPATQDTLLLRTPRASSSTHLERAAELQACRRHTIRHCSASARPTTTARRAPAGTRLRE
eukprot:scaffold2656_cov64-Phaeocystis_antarctica.AAC.3